MANKRPKSDSKTSGLHHPFLGKLIIPRNQYERKKSSIINKLNKRPYNTHTWKTLLGPINLSTKVSKVAQKR